MQVRGDGYVYAGLYSSLNFVVDAEPLCITAPTSAMSGKLFEWTPTADCAVTLPASPEFGTT